MRSPRKAVFGLCLYFLALGFSLISRNQAKITAENGEFQSLPWTWGVLVLEGGSQNCAVTEREEQGRREATEVFLYR